MVNRPVNLKLFHVSPEYNHNSILAAGVSPVFSQGKQSRCWYVDYSRLSWAISHISQKSGLSVAQLVVATVWADRGYFSRTRLSGVYTAKATLFAWAVDPAITLLRPDDLDT